jgi:choline dehydrogenase-like flavoprotein
MGDDIGTSVVDKNCLLHSCKNVYIAGSSVFPTSGNANPTFTLVALAMRLGVHLKQEITGR